MSPAGNAQVEYAPIFDWSAPRKRKLALVSFIGGSALLHALCFYVFQIIYPPTVALLPPPARVHLITPDSEEGRQLLRWVEAEDPALLSMTQRPPEAPAFSPPKPEHIPSYAGRRPLLKEPAPPPPDLRIPSARPPAAVPLARSAALAPAGVVHSSLTFSAESPGLGAATIPELRFRASTSEPPQPAEFRVGISAQGAVRYCFLKNSSGDNALDQQARSYLMLCRFPAKQNPEAEKQNAVVAWTTATVEWGNDLSAPPTASLEPTNP